MGIIATRVIALLQRVAPGVASSVIQFVQRAGYRSISSIRQLVDQVKSNPALAAVAASGLIDAGVAVMELFNEDDVKKDTSGAVNRLVVQLGEQEALLRQTLDKQADVKLGNNDTAAQLLLKANIMWAASQFGRNAESIRRAHNQLRQFVETDSATLEHGLTMYLD